MGKRERWQNEFSKWFHEILDSAQIVDYRYPIKGCGVWLPYGFQIRKNVINVIRRLLDESNHDEVLFPSLITADMLRKEAEHISSFEAQTFWITHAGGKPLEEQYALRPTSETAIAPMLKLWIRSHADLPKCLYQIVSIFRHETKATRPLIRVREVTTFKEAHTSHATHEDAAKQVEVAVKVYSDFFDALCLPYVRSMRPDWDKFAGAEYTIAFDTVFPDGRILQIGTAHHLGQHFAKAFEITYEKEDGSRDFVYQTSYGISERVIAATIAIHGDDAGLVLPPAVAPVQVVLIPIPYKGSEEKVMAKVQEISLKLKKSGIRVMLDDRAKTTPGAKFFEWEMKGVPLRIEIGPRDLQQRKVTVFRRDSQKKTLVDEEVIVDEVKRQLQLITEAMRQTANEWLKSNIRFAESIDQAKFSLDRQQGIVEVPWCGDRACGLSLEQQVDATVLGVGIDSHNDKVYQCAVCQKESRQLVRVAKTY